PNRGHDRDFPRQGRVPNPNLIFTRNLPARRVDDEINVAVSDQIEDVWPSFTNLIDLSDRDPRRCERGGSPARGADLETEANELVSERNYIQFIIVFHADENVAAFG